MKADQPEPAFMGRAYVLTSSRISAWTSGPAAQRRVLAVYPSERPAWAADGAWGAPPQGAEVWRVRALYPDLDALIADLLRQQAAGRRGRFHAALINKGRVVQQISLNSHFWRTA